MDQHSKPQPSTESSEPWRTIPTPKAPSHPHHTVHYGDERNDPYHWLRDPAYPKVENKEILSYLNAENTYLDQVTQPYRKLQQKIYEELKHRIQEDESSVPYRHGNYWYQTRYEAGAQYSIHFRRGPEGESILLDPNQLVSPGEYLDIQTLAVSPDESLLGYSVDTSGSERYELRFVDLTTRQELADVIPNTQGTITWSLDNQTLFYTRLDKNLRPSRVFRHRLGTSTSDDVEVYHEPDPGFWLGVSHSLDRTLILITTKDKDTTEVWVLNANEPTGDFRVVEPRKPGHDYSVEHRRGVLYIRTNDQSANFRVVTAPITEPSSNSWLEQIAARDTCSIASLKVFDERLVLFERSQGLPQVQIIDLNDDSRHHIEFPEPAYTVHAVNNLESHSPTLRLSYQSLKTPKTIFDYHPGTRKLETLKVQTIPSGYVPDDYVTERVLIPSKDGTPIPVSIVRSRSTPVDGSAPLYLYAYGSYGLTIDPSFSTHRVSLLNRGFIYALAHVRGGGEFGRAWYEQGKHLNKKNTFADLLACAETLIERGYTRSGEITVAGGSAGGMLVGTCVNQRPELLPRRRRPCTLRRLPQHHARCLTPSNASGVHRVGQPRG